MEAIKVIKDTDFSEEFPIGISILNKNSIHYISEERAKELYKKLGEVLGMNKVDEEKLDKLTNESAELYGKHTYRSMNYESERAGIKIEGYSDGYKAGYRAAKEE